MLLLHLELLLGVVIVVLLCLVLMSLRDSICEFALVVEVVVVLFAIDVLDSYRGLLDMLLHDLSCKV